MKKIVYILFVFCILLLSSCTQKSKHTDIDSEESISDYILNNRGQEKEEEKEEKEKEIFEIEPMYNGDIRTYDDIEKMYPDKKIVVVKCFSPNSNIVDTLNEYLISKGTDYVVYFIPSKVTDFDQYSSMVEKEMLNLTGRYDKPADVIFLEHEAYKGMIDAGAIVSLEDYLQTENGMELYQALPENSWKSMSYKGEIYGVNGRADGVYGPPSYVVNKSIMEKYEITEEDLNKPLYELSGILEKVAEGEKNNSNFKVISIDRSLDQFKCSDTSRILYNGNKAFTLSNDISEGAMLKLEDEDYINWLKALNSYSTKGYIHQVETYNIDDFFMYIELSSSTFYENPLFGRFYNTEGNYANSFSIEEVRLSDYFTSSANNMDTGNCISAYSNKKDEAFDYLYRVYTDPYVTNLLLYGIEGVNYYMEDGKVVGQIIATNELLIGNIYLSNPIYYEFVDKTEKYYSLQNSLPSPYYNFVFDTTMVQEELSMTDSIMSQLASRILTEEIDDFDTFVEDTKKQLYDNGAQRFIDEVNRQIKAWQEQESNE